MTDFEIIQKYQEGLSMEEIRKMTHYKSALSIGNILRKHGIKSRGKGGVGDKDLRHDYFENIDTEAKAYLLGFIYADGSLVIRPQSQPCIRIEINKRDIEVLELFKNEIKTKNNITESAKDCCRIAIHSKKMFDDLGKYHIIPNKSFINIDFPILEEPYMRHFIRGVFDGNGWVYPRENNITFGICGQVKAMTTFKEYFSKKLNLNDVKLSIYEGKHPFILYSAKKDTDAIFEYLYKDANYYFKRKFDKFN